MPRNSPNPRSPLGNGHRKWAQERALQYLFDRVVDSVQGSDIALPPIAHMAGACEVSFATMQKAVAHLGREGVLNVIAGHGVRVATGRSARDYVERVKIVRDRVQAEQRVPRAVELRMKIHRDLLSNRFPPGSALPTISSLAADFGASYRTVKAALDGLVDLGLLRQDRRRYRRPTPTVQSQQSTIIVLSPFEELGDFARIAEREELFCIALHKEAARLGIGLRAIPAGSDESGTIRTVRQCEEVMRSTAVVGFLGVLLPQRDWQVAVYRSIASRFGLPLVFVMVEHDTNTPVQLAPTSPLFTITGSRKAGREVGMHLMKRGHRRVAFLTPHGGTPWSRERHQGLLDIYGPAMAFHGRGDDTGGYEVSLQIFAGKEFLDLEKKLSTYGIFTKRAYALSYRGEGFTRSTLLHFMRDHQIETRVIRYLGEARKDKELTAIACCTDLTAAIVRRYLSAHGVRVPSIVGFDGFRHSVLDDIDTYDYNAEGIAASALSHLLQPAYVRRRHKQPVVEVPGFIMERGSVRRIA